MFQFPGFASCTSVFTAGYRLRGGFPHSDISGSKLVASSPKLIAGYHVLHRLLSPRHPPYALNSLDHITPTKLVDVRPKLAVKCGVSNSLSKFLNNRSSCIQQVSQRQTSALADVCHRGHRHRHWWSQAGSNRRPPACKAGALPAELWPRSVGGSGWI